VDAAADWCLLLAVAAAEQRAKRLRSPAKYQSLHGHTGLRPGGLGGGLRLLLRLRGGSEVLLASGGHGGVEAGRGGGGVGLLRLLYASQPNPAASLPE